MNSKLRAIVFPIPSDTQSARRRFSVEVLYRQHSASLVDFVAHHVRDEDAAEDIVQETFASILDGRFPVPAVDVVAKLQAVARYHATEHLELEARRHGGRSAGKARARPRDRPLRSGSWGRGRAREDEDERV